MIELYKRAGVIDDELSYYERAEREELLVNLALAILPCPILATHPHNYIVEAEEWEKDGVINRANEYRNLADALRDWIGFCETEYEKEESE